MGAAASIVGRETTLTAEEVGDLIGSIGPAYVSYKELFVNEGIDAFYLHGQNEEEFKKTLTEIGISKELHINNICKRFVSLAGAGRKEPETKPAVGVSGGPSHCVNADMALKHIATAMKCLDLPKGVSVTPRNLMSDLFQIQGIALDPSDIDVSITKISNAVGSSNGVCDGLESYDAFINYRVAADADLAEKLYYALKANGINCFLDRKCLKDGEPWKAGFLTGISRSRKFICLMSSSALAKVRDPQADHTFDNVLLEYEMALKIRRHVEELDQEVAMSYVVPVHVGHFSLGVLTKFIDFNPNLYPDSVKPVATTTTAVTASPLPLNSASPGSTTNHNPTVVTSKTESPVVKPVAMDLSTCEGIAAALVLPSLDAGGAEAALRACANLAWRPVDRLALDSLGICNTLMIVAKRFSNNEYVSAQACHAIAALAFVKEMRDKLTTGGAAEFVANALKAFPNDKQIAENACFAVTNLTAGSAVSVAGVKERLIAADICQGIVNTLKTFPTHKIISEKACFAACNLSVNSSIELKEKVGAVGLHETIVHTLSRIESSGSSPVTAEKACWCISSMIMGTPTMRSQMIAAGVCEVIVATIQRFPSNNAVMLRGCQGITSVLWEQPDSRQRFIDAGAMSVLSAVKNNNALEANSSAAAAEAIDVLHEEYDNTTAAKFPNGTVVIKDHRNIGRIFANGTIRFHNFNTFVGDVRLNNGNYYYEVEVCSYVSSPQFGWALNVGFDPIVGYTNNGVGDDKASWGFDGERVRAWHGGDKPYGKAWNIGDTLGLAIDLVSANKTVSFSVNGDFSAPCGVAYSNIDIPSGCWIRPAFSAQKGKYRINFGDRPFKHTPPDSTYVAVNTAVSLP